MKPFHPIEIVGGGLAGLSLGLALRGAEVPVTIFEAGDYPRHRVCGEFITGLDDATITALGLEFCLNDALRPREVAWFLNGQLTNRQRLPVPARALSRHRLDARLAAAFTEAGGLLRTHTRITDPAPLPGRVLTTGRRRSRSDWLGLKIHALDLPLAGELEFHLGTDAYVGLTRVESRRVNICGLFRRRELCAKGHHLLLAYLSAAGLGVLAERLARATLDDHSFSAVAALDFSPPPGPAEKQLTLGDAWSMIPPFTGNGMAMAFQSAECALDPLLAFARHTRDWTTTTHAIQTALARRFRVRLAGARLVHPFLLRPSRQRWLTRLARTHLLPLRPLYTLLH